MRYRSFGISGFRVSALGFGCSRLGGVFTAGTSQRGEVALIRAAMDAGITFFDTADVYSHGQSEIVLGKAIRGRRSEVIIATKGGYLLAAQSRLVGRAKPLLRPLVRAMGLRRATSAGGPAGVAAQDFSPSHMAAALEASLRRLGTDHVDIYQLHSPPSSVVEAGEFLTTLQGLQAQGKIRHIGLAADEPDDVSAFARLGGVASIQVPFSAIDRRAHALFPDAANNGVGVISRSCYAAGLLLGSLTEAELRERTPDWQAIVDFRATAADLGRSPRELALQFNLGTEVVATTIVGMRTPDHLHTNLRAEASTPLNEDEMAALIGLDPPA